MANACEIIIAQYLSSVQLPHTIRYSVQHDLIDIYDTMACMYESESSRNYAKRTLFEGRPTVTAMWRSPHLTKQSNLKRTLCTFDTMIQALQFCKKSDASQIIELLRNVKTQCLQVQDLDDDCTDDDTRPADEAPAAPVNKSNAVDKTDKTDKTGNLDLYAEVMSSKRSAESKLVKAKASAAVAEAGITLSKTEKLLPPKPVPPVANRLSSYTPKPQSQSVPSSRSAPMLQPQSVAISYATPQVQSVSFPYPAQMQSPLQPYSMVQYSPQLSHSCLYAFDSLSDQDFETFTNTMKRNDKLRKDMEDDQYRRNKNRQEEDYKRKCDREDEDHRRKRQREDDDKMARMSMIAKQIKSLRDLGLDNLATEQEQEYRRLMTSM